MDPRLRCIATKIWTRSIRSLFDEKEFLRNQRMSAPLACLECLPPLPNVRLANIAKNFDRFTSSALSPLPKLHAPGVEIVCNNSRMYVNSGRSQDSRDQQSESKSSISVSTQLGIFGR